MTYKEIVTYIEEIPRFTRKHSLDHTREMLLFLGNPQNGKKIIHVAGTNGKGSVCAYLDAMLRAEGKSTGLFTSPHLVKMNERIVLNGKQISDEDFCEVFEETMQAVRRMQDAGLEHPTFFEFLFAMAMKAYDRAGMEYIVLETGLGGRLDATSSVEPVACVITSIGLDHMEYLGDTVEQIAGEKAGIIKPGVPVVIGETTEETKKVFKDKSLEMNAPIRFAEEEHEVISSRSEGNTRVYETLHYGSFIGELGGLCQEKNTATILTAIDELRKAGYTIAQEHIRIGFGQVCKLTGLRGRWQQVGMSPTIICDTGHNTGGISYIADQLRGIQADKLHIVIGMVNDKDIHSVLRQLPQCATYYFTKANVKRALDEHTLQTLAKEAGLRGTSWPDVRSAFQAARQSSTKKDLIFVGGSTFIVADFLAFYHPEQA